jgi:Zn-dependent protease/predicted transcriptional regulator
MSKYRIPLGRILGIPLGVDPSWFLIFALITWSLASSYYPSEFRNWPVAQYWIVGAVTAVLFFASVVLHELGHSVVALHYKIPVRSITLFIFGGVAQIGAEPPGAMAEFWIAIAGPAVSFALAALFGLLQPVFSGIEPVLAAAKYLAYINGILGLFNLVPGFPLDGGRVFRAIVWAVTHSLRRATVIAANVGRAVAFLLVIVGVWQMFVGNFGNGLWLAFIGWFLSNAAGAQVQQQAVQDLFAGHHVSEVMNRGYPTVSADVSLQTIVEEHIMGGGHQRFIVTQDRKAVGLLTATDIKEVTRAEWPTATAAQVMLPIEQVKRVGPDTELWAALEEMERDEVNQLPVMVDSQCLGMLGRDDLINFLRTRQEPAVP